MDTQYGFNEATHPFPSSFSPMAEYKEKRMTLIGQYLDLIGYYSGDDGNVWSYSLCTRAWSNMGQKDEVLARFAMGFYHGKLISKDTV